MKDKPSNHREGARSRARAAEEAATQARSAAAKKSWKNKDVAARRALKHKVKVNGEEHHSVPAAFAALKLPMSRMGAFRAELKLSESGRKVFTDDKGNKHSFTLIAA